MSSIAYDSLSHTWLLSTPTTGYVLRLVDGVPRHVYWGPSLTLAQAAAVPGPEQLTMATFEGGVYDAEELPVDGGARFGVPSLRVRFADGTRALELAYADHTIDGDLLTVRLRDTYYPLDVELSYRVHPDSDVVERWVGLRHTGDGSPVEVLRADSASWTVPPRGGYVLRHVTGHWGSESLLEGVPVTRGETVLTSRRGTTGHHANPWLTLDAGDATEEHGEVWSAALAWSGSWQLAVTRTPTDLVSVTGGAGQDGVGFALAPGERWQTPVFAGLYSTGGYGAASRAWHRYVRAHVLPRPGELRPVLYNSWEATGFMVDVDGQRALARQAATLGVELFVMDDGWFGARVDDHAGLGDWSVNPVRFPEGLGPLVEEVHKLGMRFGIWVEPEMVNPDSDLYRAHPDWVLHFPHRTRTQLRNQLVLNFARPDVAQWAHAWLDKLVAENDIDFIKWDMNRPLTEAGWPEAGADGDRLWHAYVRNLYGVLDRLRADHPDLRIETCSGGGGRVDLGILRRTDEAWTSDNTDASDRLHIQYGYSQVYPAQTMAAWVTDVPNFLTGRSVPLRFRFHVAMSGVLGVGGNLPLWTDAELAEATALIEQYKRIRPVVQHGELYRLRPPHGDGLSTVQYVAVDGAESVAFFWLPAPHFGRAPHLVPLRGLDPAARYRDADTGEVHHGAVLLGHGVRPQLPTGDYASTVLHLVRED
ncbi:MAG TPA: alpha-galactosidase [Rugosimonospora sp.]|nr:alpha-galactosidase [Rugosimonospora sp.]